MANPQMVPAPGLLIQGTVCDLSQLPAQNAEPQHSPASPHFPVPTWLRGNASSASHPSYNLPLVPSESLPYGRMWGSRAILPSQ